MFAVLLFIKGNSETFPRHVKVRVTAVRHRTGFIYLRPPALGSCELLSGRRYSHPSQTAAGWLTMLHQDPSTLSPSTTRDPSWMEMTSELRDE